MRTIEFIVAMHSMAKHVDGGNNDAQSELIYSVKSTILTHANDAKMFNACVYLGMFNVLKSKAQNGNASIKIETILSS